MVRAYHSAMFGLSSLSRSVAGRVVLITGAASGMGRATARLFAAEGAHVAVTDLRAADVDREVADIVAEGGVAAGWELDVTDRTAIDRVVGEVAERWGRLDVLVNNAGIGVGADIASPDFLDAWQLALDVMLTAHVHTVQACLPHLRVSDAGRVINISSTEGLSASRNMAPYTTAKHGVIGLTRSLAVQLGRDGITVNAICPGPIHTGLTAAIPDEHKQRYARRKLAIPRYGEPEEIAHMVLSLALPAASYVTGVALPVDGGLTVRGD